MPFDHKFLRAKEYLAIHPLGRIPALKDEEMTLFESGAICEYLCEKYDSPLNRPPGHPERPLWLQWIHYAETLLVHGQNLVQQYIFVSDAERSPVVINLESRRIGKGLDMLDAILAKHDYILPSGFSGADTSPGLLGLFHHRLRRAGRPPQRPGLLRPHLGPPGPSRSHCRQARPRRWKWLLPRLGPKMSFRKKAG